MSQNAKPAVVNGWQRWVGLFLPLLAGILFLLTPMGGGLEGVSYDLLFLFKPTTQTEGVVMVYMDEMSFRELKQTPANWDRSLHAGLLDRLTSDHAKLVVFDIVFSDPRSETENQNLKQAMKRNGRVVLAATLHTDAQPGLAQITTLNKSEVFADSAASWGVAEFIGPPGSVIRQYFLRSEWGSSLPVAAATVAGIRSLPSGSNACWLNFYGPHGTFQRVSYWDATNQPPGFFRDKAVFVGVGPKDPYAFEESDEFRTPYSRWGGAGFPGVEGWATAYLNLARNETVTRLHPIIELVLVIFWGLGLGWCSTRLKLLPTAVAVGAGVLVVLTLAVALHWWQHIWFSWMVLAGVQIPVALAWSIGVSLRKTEPAPELSPFFTFDGKLRIPNIPDHTLIQRIGVGAYGEVWLARNTIGMFHAVKFIFRDRYRSAEPYKREFSGMEKYMPISMDHPWLVHVLHVGENDQTGYFYYIMEVGDDEVSGQQIDPAKYAPKNLSKELSRRGRFPVEECVTMGLQLTTALDHLHKNGLIHRDIKPSNIIFVAGIPKLADIGLVAEVQAEAKTSSYVGTDGYIPPEGPGTPAGDVYSLGKVLYEASMGRDRKQYPDLPTSVVEGKAGPGLLQFNEIILKACESNPSLRYQSASEIHADLVMLQNKLQTIRVN